MGCRRSRQLSKLIDSLSNPKNRVSLLVNNLLVVVDQKLVIHSSLDISDHIQSVILALI